MQVISGIGQVYMSAVWTVMKKNTIKDLSSVNS